MVFYTLMTNTPNFLDLLDAQIGKKYIDTVIDKVDTRQLSDRWYQQTGEAGEIYPSQGLLSTKLDFLDYLGKTLLSESELRRTLKMRRYMLEIFNHPERLKYLEQAQFTPPPRIKNQTIDYSIKSGLSLSVGDLGAVVTETDNNRISRRHLLMTGPFLKLGKWPRLPFAGGAMPDVYGSPASLATMAMSHCLACVPRNGVFTQVKRQVDLTKAAFEWMLTEGLLTHRSDRDQLLTLWRRNLVGVVEPEKTEGLKRAKALFKAGIRAFRVYSPEPGNDSTSLVEVLRKEYANEIEIFAGQIVSVRQAKKLTGLVDGLYLGIGGGGRCITAARSDSVVDWPSLVWQLRGRVDKPLLIEGGASDHIGTTLLLGGSGIGVSRIASGGTIESPGGMLYYVDKAGKWFKPYGGEASARTKLQDGKMLAFGLPAFVEGETTKAYKSYVAYTMPTLTQNLYYLIENLILAMVFRGVSSIGQLHSLSPSPIRRLTSGGAYSQGTH